MRSSRQWPSLGCLIVLCLTSSSGRLLAQTAQPARRIVGKAELSLVSATGNSETQTFGAGGEFEFRPDRWHVLLRANGVHSSSENRLQAESLTALARATHQLADGFEAFGQTAFLHNRFSGIASRIAAEAGITYAILPEEAAHSLRLVTGFGVIREEHVATPTERFATGSAGAQYRWRLSDHSEVGDEATVTWNLDDGGDWRGAQRATLTAALTEIVSLKLSQQLEFRHRPEPGFRRTDTLTSAALVVAF